MARFLGASLTWWVVLGSLLLIVAGQSFSSGLQNRAGLEGHLVVDNGTLAFSKTKNDATLFGVNFKDYLESRKRISDEEMIALIDDLKALGINFIRFQTNTAKLLDDWHTTKFNSIALDNRDRFIFHALNRGIYFHMNLHTRGAALEYAKLHGAGSESIVSNTTIIETNKKFIKAMLEHVNPYTGVAYKDEVGIVSLQLGNEHHAFSREIWRNNYENYKGEFLKDLNKSFKLFTDTNSINVLDQDSWGGCREKTKNVSEFVSEIECGVFHHNKGLTRKFLENIQSDYYKKMVKYIRADIGDTLHLISDNGWIRGGREATNQAHEYLDAVDLQHYFPHGERKRLPVGKNYNSRFVGDYMDTAVASILSARYWDGKPFPVFVTEYHSHIDNQYRWQLYPIYSLISKTLGVSGTAIWYYAADRAFKEGSAYDHWFAINRHRSDLLNVVMPITLAAELFKSDRVPVMRAIGLKDVKDSIANTKEKFLIDDRASSIKYSATDNHRFEEMGFTIDKQNNKLKYQREGIVFALGYDSINTDCLSVVVDSNKNSMFAVIVRDGKDFCEFNEALVFTNKNISVKLAGFDGAVNAKDRLHRIIKSAKSSKRRPLALEASPEILVYELSNKLK